jgi:hypothetical protein
VAFLGEMNAATGRIVGVVGSRMQQFSKSYHLAELTEKQVFAAT